MSIPKMHAETSWKGVAFPRMSEPNFRVMSMLDRLRFYVLLSKRELELYDNREAPDFIVSFEIAI